jgi:hypothetical protein
LLFLHLVRLKFNPAVLKSNAVLGLFWVLTIVTIIFLAFFVPLLLVVFVIAAILLLKIPLPKNQKDPVGHILSLAGIREMLRQHAEQDNYRKFLAGQQRIKDEELRILSEEQNKRDEIADHEQKNLELERLNHLHQLWDTQFSEYLIEAEKFRSEYGKNVRCDICGKWEAGLTLCGDKTFCANCMPGGAGPNIQERYH